MITLTYLDLILLICSLLVGWVLGCAIEARQWRKRERALSLKIEAIFADNAAAIAAMDKALDR